MQNPNSPLLVAERALKTGQYDVAETAFDEYLTEHPSDLRAVIGAADVQRAINNPKRVCQIYQNAVDFEPENLGLRADLIDTIGADQRPEDAMELAKEELAQHPEYLRFKWQIAQGHMNLGDLNAARQILWECHETDPKQLDPIFYLTELADSADLPRLSQSLDELWRDRDEFDTSQMVILGYARGKIAEKMKQYDDAWESFAAGAKARRIGNPFNEMNWIKHFDLHKRMYTAKTIAVTSDPDKEIGSNVIFIISLPRSGSTLVEQILASHDRVTAIGERSHSTKAFDRWFKQPSQSQQEIFRPEAIAAARDDYLNAAYKTAGRSDKIIIDKSISNFLFVGFLQTILPGARFVHVTRSPLDTAFSCFATVFYSGVEWSYDLQETGRSVRRYQKLMRHWMKCLPDSLKTFRYEDFVNDTEPTAKELLDFCGLDWDPSCLEFYKTKRAVMTSSVVQVRKPIYQSAKGRAAHFDAHLGPLKAAMGRASDPDWFLNN